VTLSKVVKSCQFWPPCATGIRPAFFSASAATKNSSQVVGSLAPAFWNAAGLAHS